MKFLSFIIILSCLGANARAKEAKPSREPSSEFEATCMKVISMQVGNGKIRINSEFDIQSTTQTGTLIAVQTINTALASNDKLELCVYASFTELAAKSISTNWPNLLIRQKK